MSKGYDITLQITIKDVRVEEGHATKAQVAKAICETIGEDDRMDLWGLNHGREVVGQLRDAGIDVSEIGFYGSAKCKVVNPGKGGRQGNPSVRKLVSDAMK
jgi:hypothetical protein